MTRNHSKSSKNASAEVLTSADIMLLLAAQVPPVEKLPCFSMNLRMNLPRHFSMNVIPLLQVSEYVMNVPVCRHPFVGTEIKRRNNSNGIATAEDAI